MEKKVALLVDRKGISTETTWNPSPPSLPRTTRAVNTRKKVGIKSVTRNEIDKFWRRKRMEEEEHLLAAQKAAARIKARALTEEDYRRFEKSWDLIDCDDNNKKSKEKEEWGEELPVGIKDWWTKSQYAYLNQPAIRSMDMAARRANSTCYIPNSCSFYSPVPPQSTTITISSSLGVL